jgi:xylulokinase
MSILGLDIGTTGTKSIVFDGDGKQLATSYEEYSNIFPEPGWVEFDVGLMWEKIFSTIKAVNSDPEVKKDPVEAISVSTIGESFTPVDKDGNTLYNTIYSTDARSVKELESVYEKISSRDLFEINGYPASYICPLNKIIWLKNNRPEIYKKTHKLLFTQDLLYHKLGIQDTMIDYSLCSRTLFFDIRKKTWSKEILEQFDIDIDLFSKPVQAGTLVGTVSEKIAQELGFNKKVSVVAGLHDQPAAAFGVGAIEDGIAADGMGTVECVTVAMKDLVLNDDMYKYNFSVQAYALKDMYVTLGFNFTSGSSLKWYRDTLASHEKEIARKKGIDVYDTFFKDLDFKPSGLLVLPYFTASGTPYIDPKPKASIIGMSLATTKKDIFKAIVEGLVFEIKFITELMQSSGVNIKELRAVGGGSKSDYWLRLKSSVMGKPIKKMKINEAGCLATMMLAGHGIGKFGLKEAIGKFVKTEKAYEPQKDIYERYMDSYERYTKLYPSIKDLV